MKYFIFDEIGSHLMSLNSFVFIHVHVSRIRTMEIKSCKQGRNDLELMLITTSLL